MTVVGAFARLDPDDVEGVSARLSALRGVSTFEVDAPDAVGVLIEADSLDAAHVIVTKCLRGVEGVLGAWPVYVGLEESEATSAAAATHVRVWE